MNFISTLLGKLILVAGFLLQVNAECKTLYTNTVDSFGFGIIYICLYCYVHLCSGNKVCVYFFLKLSSYWYILITNMNVMNNWRFKH